MENLEIMYFHGSTVDGNRFTVSGLVQNDELQLAIAVCSEKESFCKEKGRKISTGRLLNQRRGGKGNVYISMYAMNNEFKTETGFPENYYVGNEKKIFRSACKEFNFFNKKELISIFRLHN